MKNQRKEDMLLLATKFVFIKHLKGSHKLSKTIRQAKQVA